MFIILKTDKLAMACQAEIIAQGGAEWREHAACGGMHVAAAGCLLKCGQGQLKGLERVAKHGVSSSFLIE
ncbi:hypothetical protein [Arthrobacter sp. 08Y14]|uniref:hypothetical protein n=1 Tax=Arthrobacter sp. 08Y14 TaxID=2058885 RepID=UPI000CE548CE